MRESIQIMLPLRRILAYFRSSDLNSIQGYCIFYRGVEWVFGINATEKKILGFGIQLSHHARPLRPRLYIPLLATWSLRSPSSVLSPGGPGSRGTSPPVTHRRRIALLATCRCNVGFHAVSCYHKGWRQKQCCYVWNTDFFICLQWLCFDGHRNTAWPNKISHALQTGSCIDNIDNNKNASLWFYRFEKKTPYNCVVVIVPFSIHRLQLSCFFWRNTAAALG